MPNGQRDLSNIVLPTGWDAALLAKLDRETKFPYTQIVGEIDGVIGALNGEIATDSLYSSLVSYTDRPEVKYRVGTSNGFEPHTEYGRPDPKRGATEGHLIPLFKWDRMLGWTADYLEEADPDDVRADIADALKDARDLVRVQFLTRPLKRIDDAVGTGYSPGFATAAASTAVDFVPLAFGGTSFTSAHEHYVAIAGGAFTAAVFTDAKDELAEHGHEPPFEFVIGPSDEVAVRALTGFAPVADPLIQAASTTALAAVGEGYIGAISGFRIRVVRGIPQYYGFGYKSYGPNSQRNPLRVRVPKGQAGLKIIARPDPNMGQGLYPIQNLMLYAQLGVGVADRTNGTARYVNNASWSDGVPT